MARSLSRSNTINGVVTENSGTSQNGTVWVSFSSGLVDLTFANGNTTTINPPSLGLSVIDAIVATEKSHGIVATLDNLTDDVYIDLVDDIVGLTVKDSSFRIKEGIDTDIIMDRGLPPESAALPMFMDVSETGIKNLVSLIGFFPVPTLNNLNQYVVGYLEVITDDALVQFYRQFPISRTQALSRMLDSIKTTYIPLIQSLIRTPLSQVQFDSLIGSAITMGPTRFGDSGIPEAVNNGDTASAASIRSCYNTTNGEYDPAKGFQANTQAAGIDSANPTQTDAFGNTLLSDPQLSRLPKIPDLSTLETNLLSLPQVVTSIISLFSQTAKTVSVTSLRSIMFGIFHQEQLTESNGLGMFKYEKDVWFKHVRDMGVEIPEIATISHSLKKYQTYASAPVAVRTSVTALTAQDELQTQLIAMAIEQVYIPSLRENNIQPTPGNIWVAHHYPSSNRNLSSDARRMMNGTVSKTVSQVAQSYGGKF